MPESLRLLLPRWARVGAIVIAAVACQSKPLSAGVDVGPVGGDEAGNGGGPASPTQIQVLDQVHVSSDATAEHFQRASAAVDFGNQPVESATLRVTLESPCFPFAKWGAPGVPHGQNWPALCDAFDRTISVALDEPDVGTGGAPGIELLRAITPFGGPLEVEADVTDVVNGLPGLHQLGIHIDTFSDAAGLVSGSKGEWIASVALSLTPGTAPRQVLSVVPLVLGAQTAVDAEPVQFQVPDGIGSAHLEYRVTGHGAVLDPSCRGPAEEFCRRTHELQLDAEPLATLSPWRDDCATLCTMASNESGYGPSTYCAENPCGDPASVRAPRANWCPGSMTAPFVIESPALSVAGPHELTRSIQGLADGGKWQVSATYFGFE